MQILLIAPQPFFQERGTPIAVKLLLETLIEFGHKVDLLTYHEGNNVCISGLRIFRISRPPFVKNVPIGFSWKKIISDFYITIYFLFLISKNQYNVIHAVEESIFPCALVNLFFKKKLVYDMDSSLSDQLIEQQGFLKYFNKLFELFERWAIKQSDLVLPVCKYLGEKVKKYDSTKNMLILEDVAFEPENNSKISENLKSDLNFDGLLGLYVGNLEPYQGIDLMLDSIAKVKYDGSFKIAIIGGTETQINLYKKKIKELNIDDIVVFIGPRPLKSLHHYLSQADILLSPRLKGKNTPMKIYSYLSSGKPVLATEIVSHTQVMNDTCAKLVNPKPEEFALGLQMLLSNNNLRQKLGENGSCLANNKYSLAEFKRKLLYAYNSLSV